MEPILRDIPEAFETRRLRIRAPLPEDGEQLQAAKADSVESLRPWMPWALDEPTTVAASEENVRRARLAYLERTDLRLHLYLKSDGTMVGSSGLHRLDWSVPRFEVGYWCRTGFEGCGYITEAVRGICAFAFENLGAERLEVRCDSLNDRSRRVIERTGFRPEGELRNADRSTTGELRDLRIYSLTPQEYRELRDSAPEDYEILILE